FLTSPCRVADNASKLFGQIFDALHQCADHREVMPAMFADDRFVFDLFSAKRAFHENRLSPRHWRMSATIANQRIRSPEQRMRVAENAVTRTIDRAWSVEQRHHRLAQGFTARDRRIRGLPPEYIGDQFARRNRMYRPIGDQ